MSVSINSTNSKGTGSLGPSCKAGVSALLIEIELPEALQTSSDIKYFTWPVDEIEMCVDSGDKIETSRATRINRVFNLTLIF